MAVINANEDDLRKNGYIHIKNNMYDSILDSLRCEKRETRQKCSEADEKGTKEYYKLR